MRGVPIILACAAVLIPTTAAAQQAAAPPPGRYQMVVTPSHPASPFLLDTATGCVWHAIQDPETKRMAFIEVEVQNLHWGLGSQQLLISRIDSATELNADQKRAIKEELDRTRCGAFSVLLTPPAPTPGATPPPGPTKAPVPPPAKAPTRR